MTELLNHLALGFETALTLQNLVYCFTGCLLGTLIGVLPGLGPSATIAMLLPVTYALPPVAALIMLSGIYYGAQYGGSTTAILVNLPGESSSVVTAIDGYQMARQGRAGVALATVGLSSFGAGCVATLVLAAFATPMSELAFKFGPAEYFSLMLLGLVGAVVLASGSLVKAVGAIILGLLLGMVGTDVNSGVARYSFDIPELTDSLNFVALAMGLFGFAEIVTNLEQREHRETFTNRVTNLFPTREDFRRMIPAAMRGTALGTLLGMLPGGGATLSSFASYTIEKKLSSRPQEFGRGAIEGVAGPEAANNAGAQTSFIPLLTLGIPSNVVMALMVGAMTIHNIQPGPQVMTSNPELFWGLIVSMWIGNAMLIILNLPLIGLWVKLLKVPYRYLYPAILVFCCIGVYSINNNTFDVYQAAGFGLIGYLFVKLTIEPAPLLLGFVLGPMMEENLRRAMLLSRGDFSTFVTRPLSLGLLVAAVLLVALVALQGSKRPDAPAVAHAAIRAAVAEAAQRLPGVPLFAGGKSYGGRMTTQAQAAEPLPGVKGIVLVGFPLHPAGKPSVERGAHLAGVKVPMLFLQGTRDGLADLELVRDTTATLGKRATLHIVDGADHAFHVLVRSGRNDDGVREELLDTLASWMRKLAR